MTKSPNALSFDGLEVAAADRPKTSTCRFDLDLALSSVVAVHARVPADAYTAEALGSERVGNGVVVREDGVVLTIGYLITEADAVTLTTADGRTIPAHPLGVDGETGFGLLQALEPLHLPAVRLGDSSLISEGEPVVVAGAGGARHAVAARLSRGGPSQATGSTPWTMRCSPPRPTRTGAARRSSAPTARSSDSGRCRWSSRPRAGLPSR